VVGKSRASSQKTADGAIYGDTDEEGSQIKRGVEYPEVEFHPVLDLVNRAVLVLKYAARVGEDREEAAEVDPEAGAPPPPRRWRRALSGLRGCQPPLSSGELKRENERNETRGLQVLVIIHFQFSIIHSRGARKVVGIRLYANPVRRLRDTINY
jgi:hypothetical protein